MDQKIALKQLRQIDKLKGDMRLAGEKWKTKFQTLISIILSARTLDETTIKVCEILFSKYPDAKSLSKSSENKIQKIIKPINFYRNKSKSILNCSKQLNKEYNGEPPMDFDKLTELSGVGGKTANVFLSEYGDDAIGIDTHVSYVSQYLDWVKSNKPEKIEEELRELFPKNKWKILNTTLVRFGKKYTSRKEKDKLLDEINEIK
jgi:endonuclease-3